jgi:hypothetical protein
VYQTARPAGYVPVGRMPERWSRVRRVRSGFAFPALGLALATVSLACAARGPQALHCADGALPCADQIVAVHCEALSDGMAPPDLSEVRWMFDGARLPQRGEPGLNVTSWCSGTLEIQPSPTSKLQLVPIELFQGVEGGYLQVAGRDRIWFEAPPEESDAKNARFCVDQALPLEILQTMECKPPTGGTVTKDVRAAFGHARRVDLTAFGSIEGNPVVAWCEGSVSAPTAGFEPGRKVRVDLFEGGRGWIRLPGEKRLCFEGSGG